MTNIVTRYLVAVIAVPVMIYVLIKLPSWVFALMVSGIMLMVLFEWLQLINGLKLTAPMTLGMTLGAVQLAGVYAFSVSNEGFVLFFTNLLVLLGLNSFGLINLSSDIKQRSVGNGIVLMAIMMCSLGGGSLMLLREVNFQPDGRFWVLMLLAVVWIGDAGAMHFGKMLGRHKLAPVISPKKTVEGLIAGAITGTLAGSAVYYLFDYSVPFWHILLLGPLLVILAHIGDLTASMTKRAARVKDSSHLIPGHGGYLDRFDNILLSAPFLYVYIKLIS